MILVEIDSVCEDSKFQGGKQSNTAIEVSD